MHCDAAHLATHEHRHAVCCAYMGSTSSIPFYTVLLKAQLIASMAHNCKACADDTHLPSVSLHVVQLPAAAVSASPLRPGSLLAAAVEHGHLQSVPPGFLLPWLFGQPAVAAAEAGGRCCLA